jgi:all-trans-8'-apo-beta-carotenal 15,15'-oxygenase
VFVLAPIILDPVRAMSGFGTAERATSWRPELGTRIVLLPRGGGPRREIECPPLVYVHTNNAFEDGEDIVVELIRYDDYQEFFRPVRDFRAPNALDGFGGYACRVRLTRRDRVILEDLTDQRTELPQHDQRRTARAYRYGYHTVLTGDSTHPGRLVKHDNHTGLRTEHHFEAGDIVGEPIFVPRSATAAEDDGWLLTVVYLAAEHRSALVVLDAQHIQAAPLATARLDQHFYPGFHGSFTSRVTPAHPTRPA